MHTVLINPRNPHRPAVYLPNGVTMIASQLATARLNDSVTVIDLNLDDIIDPKELAAAEMVGISVMGTPNIPEALALGKRIRTMGCERQIMIGGQGVMRLTRAQFDRIYGRLGKVRQVTSHQDLELAVHMQLDPAFETSLDVALQHLVPQHYLKEYLATEWCLFTSDGCKYNCRFCAASKAQSERFRSQQVIAHDVNAIAVVCRQHGRSSTDAYLSSLDILQNPEKMEELLGAAAQVAGRHDVMLHMRGLATAQSIIEAVRDDRDILNRWRVYGVHTIGIGVDGYDPGVWKRQNKRHNTHHVVREALDAIMDAGMTAEALMVIGFRDDTWESMRQTLEGMHALAREGIVVRPYLGKEGAPGSETWKRDENFVEQMLQDPERFQLLDYSMLGSRLTHPDTRQRRMANAVYLAAVLGLKLRYECPTQPLLPVGVGSLPRRVASRLVNAMLPPDK